MTRLQLVTYFLYQLLILNIMQLTLHFVAPGLVPDWFLLVGFLITNLIRALSGDPGHPIIIMAASIVYGVFVGFIEYNQVLWQLTMVATIALISIPISHNIAIWCFEKTTPKESAWCIPGSYLGFQAFYVFLLWDYLHAMDNFLWVVVGYSLVPFVIGFIATNITLRITYFLAMRVFPGPNSGITFWTQMSYYTAINMLICLGVLEIVHPGFTWNNAGLIAAGGSVYSLIVMGWFKELSESKRV